MHKFFLQLKTWFKSFRRIQLFIHIRIDHHAGYIRFTCYVGIHEPFDICPGYILTILFVICHIIERRAAPIIGNITGNSRRLFSLTDRTPAQNLFCILQLLVGIIIVVSPLFYLIQHFLVAGCQFTRVCPPEPVAIWKNSCREW
jgi:hypothetical protein